MQDLRRAALCFGILLAVYLLYSVLLVPWIEPPAPQASVGTTRIGAPAVSATDRYHADLQGLFPEDAWENQSPKVLRNRNILLLFKDYQPQEDGTLRVYPCTAVVVGNRDSDAERRATSLILQAPQGAVLQLNRPVDLHGTQFGQPVAGFLLGRIQIHCAGHPDGTGRLNIVTSDVQIKPETILTPHDVDLQYEQNHARGRDLMIRLVGSTDQRGLDRTQGWVGIASIQLVHLERLHLDVGNSPATATDDPPRATPVDVACQGPLRVDFVENQVTLEEQVELRRQSPEGIVDTLQCQKLTLSLQQAVAEAVDAEESMSPTVRSDSPPSPGPASPPRGDPRLASLPRLQVRRVVAEGDPVILDAPSQRAHIRSRKLMYDLQIGRFQLWAAPDDPQDQVLLRYEQQQMLARELDGLLEASEGSSTQQLQAVRATGPGQFRGLLTGTNPQVLQAAWQSTLVFQREQELHRLTLDQNAEVYVGDSYGIEAESIDLWLEPAPQHLTPTRDHPTAAFSAALRPRRVVAQAHAQRPSARPVRLRSTGVIATTQRLDAHFRHGSAVEAATTAGRTSPLRTASSTRPLPGADRPAAVSENARETRIFGRQLEVVLQINGRDVSVDQLVLQQDVRLQQFAVQDPNRALFDLRADTVSMRDPTARQMHVLTATGSTSQPVWIQADQFQLQTSELNLDQARNLVWSDRPGRMIVQLSRDANGQPLPVPQEMTVDWFRNMTFDGLKARFGGGVEVYSPDQRLRGTELEAQLTRRVEFSNASRDGQVEIQELLAKGNVEIVTREVDQGRMVSLSILQVPYASIDRLSGNLQAGGPGRIVTLQEGFRNNLTMLSDTRAAADPAAETLAKTFLQVDYQREATGNLYRKVVDFVDRVEVIYGPVLSWNETLSADAPLRKNDVLLSCDKLTVAQSPPRGGGSPVLDLIAQGNTYVEGQTFTARGDRISYDHAKELLVLEGTGRSNAVLSHQARVGAPREDAAARKILYWVRTQRVDVVDATFLDLSNLGN